MAGPCMSDEDYLMAAFEMNSADFLDFFSEVSPQVQQRYVELCSQNSTLDEFMSNPLIFILANKPRCCAHIARDYVDRRYMAADSGSDTGDSQAQQRASPGS
mmetsp:Transcript_96968/g.269813  ORF Transcript_96968/g.269813 Transcript_96968/m.269813 type:complete len:102 (+) Transcript_96968:68-373(+)|eukprot:CAMPEP_0179026780 /NCGR_PEP_ID=MMETSP0796-20121207/8696_1 /TAXON_ID=73915 /ORGANISM="Pyrodinium bahamense, Strain pbaha01" /LENGTH=101 /DNA_ID=CAMNT_0020722881 /DNA_START=65 /DNA_END=370 /DNA_ORIENTATION=-